MPYADPEMQRAYNRRRYRETRDAVIARATAWDAANPERAKARGKAWRQKNPEAAREYAREWYLANRDAVLERVRAREARLRVEQPEIYLAERRDTAARRRARLRASAVEVVDPLRVWERDNGMCGICGEVADPNAWHLDHIIPIARGGEHSYANVQVSHPLCNWRKAAS